MLTLKNPTCRIEINVYKRTILCLSELNPHCTNGICGPECFEKIEAE